jgi:TonB family protein
MSFGRSKLSLALLLIGLVSYSAQAQKTPAGSAVKKTPAGPAPVQPAPAGWREWETFRPEGEEFTVSMPKGSSSESTTFPYHKMDLKARLYMASLPGGPVVAIASFSGIKSDPSQYTDFSRFNSYVDAFKDFFPAKVRPKETVARLTLVNSKPYNGHTGRSYKMTLGDLSGVVHAYATRKRFYAIVSLNTKKDDATEEKFLSSFELPERQAEPAKNTASNEGDQVNNPNVEKEENPSTAQTNDGRRPIMRQQGGSVGVAVGVEDNTENVVAPVPAGGQQPQEQVQAQKRGPVNGGVLNGKAIYLPLPETSNRELSGVVMVLVMVDEQGNVIEARAVSGPAALQAAAVNAARLARFSTTLLMGEPVKVTGTLAYSFSKSN